MQANIASYQLQAREQAREQDRNTAAQWKGVPDQALAWAGRRDAELAKEEACRADASCVKERAAAAAEKKRLAAIAAAKEAAERAETNKRETVAALCNADYWLDDNKRVIREEKANASGVVDLSVLHDAGDAIRIHTAQIAALKPALHRGWRGWRVECPDGHGMFQPAPEDLRPPGEP